MLRDRLWRSWVWLLLLSLASTVVAVIVASGAAGSLAGAVILFLAYMKARLILSCYLGLVEAPTWYRGFKLVIGGYMILLLVLYLVPVI